MFNGPRVHTLSGEEVVPVPRPSNLHPDAKWNKYVRVSQNYKELSANEYLEKSETTYHDHLSCHIKVSIPTLARHSSL